jgi:uncharacterized membrane protein
MKWLALWIDRALGVVPWALGILFGATAVHLITVLTLPNFAPGSVYRQFARPLAPAEKALLPRAAPADSAPAFPDPFAALALCRFDLAQGPMRLRAEADSDHPTSVSVRLSDGSIIYSAGDRQTPNGRFNILIVTRAQADAQDAAKEKADEDESGDAASKPGDEELRLISPGKKGFAVFRVLGQRDGDYEAAAARRETVQCALEKPAP